MGKITLAGAIPGDVTNGLAPHAKDFIDSPLTLVPVVAMVACSKVTTKPETGETYPTLRVHHWELVPPEHRRAFAEILGDALAARTGAMELPFPDGSEVPMKTEPFPEESDEGGE